VRGAVDVDGGGAVDRAVCGEPVRAWCGIRALDAGAARRVPRRCVLPRRGVRRCRCGPRVVRYPAAGRVDTADFRIRSGYSKGHIRYGADRVQNAVSVGTWLISLMNVGVAVKSLRAHLRRSLPRRYSALVEGCMFPRGMPPREPVTGSFSAFSPRAVGLRIMSSRRTACKGCRFSPLAGSLPATSWRSQSVSSLEILSPESHVVFASACRAGRAQLGDRRAATWSFSWTVSHATSRRHWIKEDVIGKDNLQGRRRRSRRGIRPRRNAVRKRRGMRSAGRLGRPARAVWSASSGP